MLYLLLSTANAAVCPVDPAGAWPTLQSAVDDTGCDPILVDQDLIENVTINRSVAIVSSTNTVIRPASAGSILTVTGGDVSIEGVVFAEGTAVDGAGVHATTTGELRLIDVAFYNNTASGDGGGLYTTAPSILDGVVFIDNTAGGAGGGVFAAGPVLAWRDGTATGNSAVDGGALALVLVDDAELDNTLFSGNAAVQGGAWYQDGGTLSTLLVRATDNDAVDGGGIWIGEGRCDISRSSVYANNATGLGGGLFVGGGVVEAWNFNLSKNTAVTGGGMRVEEDGRTFLHFTTLADNLASAHDSGMAVAAAGSVLFDRSLVVYLPAHAWASLDCVETGRGYIGNVISYDDDLSCFNYHSNVVLTEHLGGLYYTPTANSIAVDRAGGWMCAATDLLGSARPRGGACDLGAVER